MLRAGAASVDITPEPGLPIPGQWLVRYAERVRDPLLVSAVVLEDRQDRCAIVSCDSVSIKNRIVADVRERVLERHGIPAERLILHATHTHTGPPVTEALGTHEVPEWTARQADALAAAVDRAMERLEPAEIAWHTEHQPGLAFPRRFHMSDGTVRMHPASDDPALLRPEGVPDDTFTAFGVFGAGGGPIAVVISHACHPICVGGATFYSGDYPGCACRAVRGLWGDECVALYLNGFCGDVGPDDVEDARQSGYGEAAMERMGTALAAASAGLVRARRATQTRIVGYRALVEIAERRPAPDELAEAEAAIGDRLYPIPQDQALIAKRELVLLAREQASAATVDAEVIALRLGDGAILGWQGEVFSAFSRRLRRMIPTRHAMIVSMVNGLHGYVPTREAFAFGGYETWLCRSSKLEPGAGDKLLLASRSVLDELGEADVG